ncbi:MAG: branched-chain amino acid ABC transporter permease [Actinobacteria bacterium]|nr:branched-chain amino acid ABC transporter permease [Actinomycetota bacterium]
MARHRDPLLWRGLAAAGFPGARVRWLELPGSFRRYVFPLLVLGVLLLVFLPLRNPDPGFLITCAIAYALWVMPRVPRKIVLPLVVVALAFLYPLYVDKLYALPVLETFPAMTTMVPVAIFMVMALGLNMVVGYAGLLDLGYVVFYAIGAYVAAWFASPIFAGATSNFGAAGVAPGFPGIHISIWILILAAGIITAVFGVIIGLPTLRLRGDYLAIVTLGFGEILPQVARNGENVFGFNLTNGPRGITPIDSPGFGGWSFLSEAGTYLNPTTFFYWGGLVLVAITIFSSWRLRDSRLGRAWIAIREDETAAAAMGVPLMRTKTWSYAAGAFFGGLAGCWFAAYKTGVFPDDFYFQISIFVLCMVILGGMGNIWGVLLGAAFLTYLDIEGLGNIGAWVNDNVGTNIDIPQIKFGIYGLIILAVMLFRPQGLLPEARRKAEFEDALHGDELSEPKVAGERS